MSGKPGAFADRREPLSVPAAAHGGLRLRPAAILSGPAAVELCAAGEALALAGGPLAFAALCLSGQDAPDRESRSVREALRWARQSAVDGDIGPANLIERMSAPRADFAGFALSGAGARPRIMGVCNVTPDSFSDGGDHPDPGSALAFARALVAAGADIIDVGGESTRPGARPVEPAEEADRVLPVIEALAGEGITVSIDTRRASVMRAALDAGAAIVNDVSALAGDPDSLATVAASDAAVILMHMRGTPETMQDAPAYDDVVDDVYDALAARVAACLEAGIPAGRIAVDPGLGFGKTLEHNVALLAGLAQFHGLGCAVAIGASRKSFIGALSGEADPKARLPGSLAAALVAVNRGAQIVRVHDVAETRQALSVWSAGNELLPPPLA